MCFLWVCCYEGQTGMLLFALGLVNETTLGIVTAAVINQKPIFWIILFSIWIYNGHSCFNQRWITHVACFWVWDLITTSEWTGPIKRCLLCPGEMVNAQKICGSVLLVEIHENTFCFFLLCKSRAICYPFSASSALIGAWWCFLANEANTLI